MFDYLNNINYGDNIISEINGKNHNMLMDAKVVKLKAGESIEYFEEYKEIAVLHISGKIEFKTEKISYINERNSVFDEEPCCIHVCRKNKITVVAIEETEILVQCTHNEKEFNTVIYTKENIRSDIFGDGVLNGTSRRIVRTIFDYNNSPYSNMVMGEVITFPGKWSSYPPHYHPQPEIYYYKFDRPQGFGSCFIGDDAFVIKDNSIAAIPGGLVHPQTAAPGYAMYYCWMIRHLDNNPWIARIDDERHSWLLQDDAKIWDCK